MDPTPQRTIVERFDFSTAFGFSRLFDCWRMSWQRDKIMLALLLILSLYIVGRVIDGMRPGEGVVPGEFAQYSTLSLAEFKTWRGRQLENVAASKLRGPFDSALHVTLDLFGNLVTAAVQLKPGFTQLSPYTPPDNTTVFGALRALMLTVPGWLWHAHGMFLVTFAAVGGALWSLLGGAISRLAVIEAASKRTQSASDAMRFVWRRWLGYLLTPVWPLLLVLAGAAVLAVGGLALSVPGLNLLVGLLFFAALAIGGLLALTMIGWFLSMPLMYPALSAEGTDALDAVSRAYSYAIAEPWRLVLYGLIALVYGAITYLFVGLVIFLTIYITHWACGAWMGERFASMFPMPRFGDLLQEPAYAELGTGEKVAARLIMVWVRLLIGVLGAYAISFFFTAYAVIYLQLRQRVEGVAEQQLHHDPVASPAVAIEKVEPHPSDPPSAKP